MSLYSYRKQEYEEDSGPMYSQDRLELQLEDQMFKDITIWETAGTSYSLLERIVNSSKLTSVFIPLFLIGLGSYFIFQYIYPEIQVQIQEQNGLVAQGTVAAVDENYIDVSRYISNPSGLSEVTAQAFEQNILVQDTVSNNYRGVFYITIPSLDINNIPVTANVDSTNEDAYLDVLHTTLAHFENTGLPISDVDNNIVIYGHSATSNYNPRPDDPEVAFSFLQNLKVGDDIFIDMEGERHHFKMSRSKIVEPTDTSVITGERGRRTLTLFTCYPPGNNAKRYVTVARQV